MHVSQMKIMLKVYYDLLNNKNPSYRRTKLLVKNELNEMLKAAVVFSYFSYPDSKKDKKLAYCTYNALLSRGGQSDIKL